VRKLARWKTMCVLDISANRTYHRIDEHHYMRSPIMKHTFAALFAAGLLWTSAPVIAHNGDDGRYDETPFIVTGTVVEIKLTNPHSIVVFDVTDPGGKVVRWQAEMGGGQQLTRQYGWNKEMPKIGDKITLNGRKVKSGAPYMNMTEKAQIILTATGKEIFRTQNFDGPPAASTSAAPPATKQ